MAVLWNLHVNDFDAAEEIVVRDLKIQPKTKITFWTVILGRVYEARTGFGWQWRRDRITSRDEEMKNACIRAVEWAEETIRIATEHTEERDELEHNGVLSSLYEQCGRLLYNTGNYDKSMKVIQKALDIYKAIGDEAYSNSHAMVLSSQILRNIDKLGHAGIAGENMFIF